MSRLLAVELENFQSIKERTRIDFSKLTFFVGPNSAGKSAIADSFELFKLFFALDANPIELEELVNKWKRYQSDGPLFIALELNVNLKLIQKVITKFGDYNHEHILGSDKSRRNKAYLLEESCLKNNPIRIELSIGDEVKVHREKDSLIEDDVGREFSVSIYALGCLILTIYRTKKKTVVINHQNLNGECKRKRLKVKSSANIEVLCFDIGTQAIFSCPTNAKRTSSDKLIGYLPSIMSHFSMGLSAYFRNVILLVNNLINNSMPSSNSFTNGTRNVCRDLDARLEFDDFFQSNESHYEKNPSFSRLHLEVFQRDFWDLFCDVIESRDGEDKFNDRELLDFSFTNKVNKALKKLAVSENYYQIVGETYFQFTLKEIQNISKNQFSQFAEALIDRKGSVSLNLVNQNNDKLKFEDVGDGISFVLPVILSCINHYHSNQMLQQPELHLHPGLQSELGDLLTDELGEKYTMIVETHSEHIILRILRRIRESSIISYKHNILNFNDVAVYYFDPNQTRGTLITKQNITEDGDFLYDWPKGFFSERDQDLFYD